MKKRFTSILLSLVFTVSLVNFHSTVLATSNADIRSKIISLLYGGAGGYMSCDFDGYTTTKGRHEGIDFVLGASSNIYAIADGTVTAAKTSSSGLTTIAIYNASYDVTIVYLHTKNFAVSTGSVVSKGTKIAQESNSGASAVHTHVELRTGSRTSAAISVNDYTLDNPNPYPYYERMLFSETTHTIDESYGHDFTATCTSKQYTLTENHSTEGSRWIDAGDVCTIHNVYTDGCCYVTYPSGSSTREAWGKIEWFSFTKPNTIVNLGTDFSGIIYPQERNQLAVIGNNNGNAELVEEKGYASEWWWFTRNDDGSYYIQSMVDNSYLDADNAGTNNGTNVKTFGNTNSDAQKWYIYEGSYGYQICPKHCTNICLDCTGGAISYGSNIQLYEKNGTEAQGFSLWKNSLDRFSNLGDDFYAPILNTDAWKPIINSDSNLILNSGDTNNSDEMWRFQRQEDGSYIISSCLDGKCIDVYDACSDPNTSVGLYARNETNAQKWYIIPYNNGYILKPKCSDCVLDLINNDASQGNKLQIYTKHDTGAQKWSIYRGEECQLKSPTMTVAAGTDITKTKISWNSIFGKSNYSVKIWKDTTYWDGDPYAVINTTNTNCEIQLPTGYYDAYVDVENYYQYKMSNVVSFAVHKKPIIDSDKYSVAVGNSVNFSYQSVENADLVSIFYERNGEIAATEEIDKSGEYTRQFKAVGACNVYIGAKYAEGWVYSDKIEIDVYDPDKKPTFSVDNTSPKINEKINCTFSTNTQPDEKRFYFTQNDNCYSFADITTATEYITSFDKSGEYVIYVGARYENEWVFSDKVTIDVANEEVEQEDYNINIGDYLQMGNYNGEPIMWRCVDIDENGPLMLSDKILCLKAFDAAGTSVSGSHGRGYYVDDVRGALRQQYGSPNWEDSNLRDWLNSSETAGKVVWSCGNAPTNENCYNRGGYDQEAGFLTNFSDIEKSIVKATTQKYLMDGYEYTGSTNYKMVNSHTYNANIDEVKQNSDTAYSINVTDKMFVLDVDQVYSVYKNSDVLGENYYIGIPTKKCVDNATYDGNENLSADSPWYTWVRTAVGETESGMTVRCITLDGKVATTYPEIGADGVRSAFYLSSFFNENHIGDGSLENPYVIEEAITHIVGDVNDDCKVNNKDATLMLQYFADWDSVTLNEDYLDLNNDGRKNNKDATYLLQYLAGWDVELH